MSAGQTDLSRALEAALVAPDHLDTSLIISLLDETLQVGPDLAAVRSQVQMRLQRSEAYSAALKDLLARCDALLDRPADELPYSDAWWSAKLAELPVIAANRPPGARQMWLQLVAQAIERWELEVLARLATAELMQPLGMADLLPRFQELVAAFDSESAADSLPLFDLILAGVPTESFPTLMVMAVRHALRSPDAGPETLRRLQQFESQHQDDVRCLTLRADWARQQGQLESAELTLARAYEKDPESIDTLFGLGMLEETRGRYDDADDRYAEAISLLRERTQPGDIVQALGPYHGSIDGNVYLQLARMLRRESPELALSAVDQALLQGIVHEGDSPERIGHRLRGELLEQLGRPSDAAAAFTEAALGFHARGDSAITIALLRRSLELDATKALTYWVLADALRVASHSEGPPYLDSAMLLEARDVWNRGLAIETPTERDAWAYTARAIIDEQLGRIQGQPTRELLWQAVLFMERVLIHRAWYPAGWIQLATLYRALRLPANAFAATGQAIEQSRTQASAWEERVITCANFGYYAEAREALEQRRAITAEPPFWYFGVDGFLLYREGRLAEAIDLLGHALEAAGEDVLWCLSARAGCYQQLGRAEEAGQDYQRIWSQYNVGAIDDREIFASAAYHLNHLADARSIFEALLDRPQHAARAHAHLGFLDLLAGRAEEAQAHLQQFLQIALAADLRELIEQQLPDLERRLPNNETMRALLAALGSRAAELIPLAEQRTMTDELTGIIGAEEAADTAGSVAHLAAVAGYARQQRNDSNWQKALDAYGKVHKYADGIPELSLALTLTLQSIETAAQTLVDQDQIDAAIQLLERAMAAADGESAGVRSALHRQLGRALFMNREIDAAVGHFAMAASIASDDPAQTAEAETQLGCALCFAGRGPDADQHFRRALSILADDADAGETITRFCIPLLKTPRDYWLLVDAWADADFAPARAALGPVLADICRLNEAQASYFPVVTPIAVEFSAALCPADFDSDSPILAHYLPEMCARVREQTGVALPGVRVRCDEYQALPDHTYVVMLDEIPIKLGYAYANHAYAHAAPDVLEQATIPRSSLIEAAHPVSGAAGCWVHAGFTKTLEEVGVTFLNPLEFAVLDLEAVLRANLAGYIGVQEFEELLDSWAEDAGRQELLAKAAPDAGARFHIGRLLRDLARERVPILDADAILQTVTDVDWANTDPMEVLARVRIRLQAALPGNNGRCHLVELPPDSEAIVHIWTVSQGNKTFLAIPPEETQDLLTDVRTLLADIEGQVALVTSDSRMRPFVRRLVELEFPDLMVLSRDELMPNPASQSHGPTLAGVHA